MSKRKSKPAKVLDRQTDVVEIRDRIVELRRVPASELMAHPLNWRKHPENQRAALKALLGEIGYADALIARELPGGVLQLLDGHLRAETTPGQTLPVLIVDLNDEEAAKFLATLDPLAAMAETDKAALSELTRQFQTGDQDLADLLAETIGLDQLTGADSGDEQEDTEVAFDASDSSQTKQFYVMVICESKRHQREVLEQLEAEGYECQVATV